MITDIVRFPTKVDEIQPSELVGIGPNGSEWVGMGRNWSEKVRKGLKLFGRAPKHC